MVSSVMKLAVFLLLTVSPLSVDVVAAEFDGQLPETVQPYSQEYFLLQPFHAAGIDRRSPLHHVGMLTQASTEGYRISAVLDGFPAQQAGLRRGDLVLEIDGQPFEPVRSLNPQIGDDAVTAPATRQIQLLYQRNGVQETITLTTQYGNLYDALRSATLNSTQQFNNGNKVIGYIRLWSLDRTADGLQTYRQLIESLAHCDGLIIDVRNSYGFISAEHLDSFLPNRRRYFQLENGHTDLWQPQQRARDDDDYYDRALVVIQNSGTRGGLELFAYQLASLQRAVSLGQATAGKMGQVTLANGAMRYLPATSVRVDGMQLEDNGVAPEQQIPYPLSDPIASDPQFEAAMMTLMQIM